MPVAELAHWGYMRIHAGRERNEYVTRACTRSYIASLLEISLKFFWTKDQKSCFRYLLDLKSNSCHRCFGFWEAKIRIFFEHRVHRKNYNIKRIERIWSVDINKEQPTKLVFHNEKDQQKVFLNCRNLKGKNLYNKISIREVYTFTERSLVKSFIEQAKLKNQEEEGRNSNIIWRVRGTPKNGLTLKKFTRDQKVINPPKN